MHAPETGYMRLTCPVIIGGNPTARLSESARSRLNDLQRPHDSLPKHEPVSDVDRALAQGVVAINDAIVQLSDEPALPSTPADDAKR